MRRKTEITLPSRGKPNLELAAKLMVPVIMDAIQHLILTKKYKSKLHLIKIPHHKELEWKNTYLP